MPDPVQGDLLTDPAPTPQATPPAANPPADTPKPQAEPPKAAEPKEPSLLTDDDAPEPTPDKPKGDQSPVQPLKLKPPVGVNQDDPGFMKFVKFAETKKLTQEQAEEALSLWSGSLQELTAKAKAAFAAQKAEWAKLAKADPEFGGERLSASLNQAKRAITKYGTPGLREVLAQSGLSNHPEVVRFFTRIGKTLAEDTFAAGLGTQTPPKQKLSEEQLLRARYPSMFPKEKE